MNEQIFSRNFNWFEKALDSAGIGKRLAPDKVSDVIFPTVDAFGTHQFRDMKFAAFTGTNGFTFRRMAPVPEGRIYVVLHSHAICTDTVARTLSFSIQEPNAAFEVFLEKFTTVPSVSTEPYCLSKRVVVPPKHAFGVFANNGITATARMDFNVFYVDLPLGEYLVPA